MNDETNINENQGHKSEEQNDDEPSLMSGLKGIGISIVIFGLAYYFFVTMTKYESGEGISMNRLLLIAYGLLGKNITVGILVLLGVFMGWSGIGDIMKSRK